MQVIKIGINTSSYSFKWNEIGKHLGNNFNKTRTSLWTTQCAFFVKNDIITCAEGEAMFSSLLVFVCFFVCSITNITDKRVNGLSGWVGLGTRNNLNIFGMLLLTHWTTCLLHDSPFCGLYFNIRVGMSFWSEISYIYYYFVPRFAVSCMKLVIFYSIITFPYTNYFVHSYTVDVVFTLFYMIFPLYFHGSPCLCLFFFFLDPCLPAMSRKKNGDRIFIKFAGYIIDATTKHLARQFHAWIDCFTVPILGAAWCLFVTWKGGLLDFP